MIPNDPGLSSRHEVDPTAYFQAVYDVFQDVEANSRQRFEEFFSIGGYIVCLRFIGNVLVSPLTDALRHLATSPTPSPDLTICLWDSASTKTAPPPSPLTWGSPTTQIKSINPSLGTEFDLRGTLPDYNTEPIYSAFNLWESQLSILDVQQDLALYWIQDAVRLPYYETSAPLSKILAWWLTSRNRQFVHAASVGTAAKGGVLLAGKGGSGKSTTALACLNADLNYLGDDYCLVTSKPKPYVYSIYNTAKLKGQSDLERFPQLATAVSNLDQLETQKALLFLEDTYSKQIASGLPLKAILLPQVTHRSETLLQPVSAMTALKRLAPSTLFQLPGNNRLALRHLSKLTQQLPCYSLTLGTDFQAIPDIILTLLASLS